MGVGNFLAIRAHERAREADDLPEEESYPWKHGLATLLAFVVAGAVPLIPYVLPIAHAQRTGWSTTFTLLAMFLLGIARARVTLEVWWKSAVETLLLGIVVAAAAYGAGALVAAIIRTAAA
jgi:VIT1/CCC1 family predicted Fe2+/Mn2+ transporter